MENKGLTGLVKSVNFKDKKVAIGSNFFQVVAPGDKFLAKIQAGDEVEYSLDQMQNIKYIKPVQSTVKTAAELHNEFPNSSKKPLSNGCNPPRSTYTEGEIRRMNALTHADKYVELLIALKEPIVPGDIQAMVIEAAKKYEKYIVNGG